MFSNFILLTDNILSERVIFPHIFQVFFYTGSSCTPLQHPPGLFGVEDGLACVVGIAGLAPHQTWLVDLGVEDSVDFTRLAFWIVFKI